MNGSIGIFAPAGDMGARDVFQALASSGREPLFFDMDLPSRERVALDGEGARWNGCDLGTLHTALVAGMAHENPVVPEPEGVRDFSVWQADYPARQQKYSFLLSLFTRLERMGVRMVNPTEGYRAMFAKGHLLLGLAREGFTLPELLVSNDPEQAEAFCAAPGLVVWRPQGGRSPWQLCKDKQRRAVVRPDMPPPILARAEDGPLVRSWVFEGRPLLSLSARRPSMAVPERLERMVPFDHTGYESELGRLAETLGLPWFQVLFVPQGERMVIYDLDADPVLDWLPPEFRRELIHALAAGLASGMDGSLAQIACQPTADGPGENRPALFLRRMLRTLFEFEQCKYGGDDSA